MNQETNPQTDAQYINLRHQAAANTQALATLLAMGAGRAMGLGLQSAKAPNNVQGIVAPISIEAFNRFGQSLTALEAPKDINNYAAVQSIEVRGATELVVANTEDFERLLERLEKSAGTPFEQTLAQIAKAIQATGRKSDVYLTDTRNNVGSWLKATSGQTVQKILLTDNTQATVARLSLDARYVTTFVENAFLVIDRPNATRGEGSNWAVKPFDLGVLLHITPLADDGYFTATFQDEEGERFAVRMTSFTPNDDLLFAGTPFNTHGGIVMRDDPNEAYLVRYDADADDDSQIAKAFLYAAQYDTRRAQKAPGTTDQVFNPGQKSGAGK